jgi:hypothetical protein
MPLVGFKPAIPATEQPQTHALDRAANQVQNCMDPGRIIQDFNFQFSTYRLIFSGIRKENDEQKGRKREG